MHACMHAIKHARRKTGTCRMSCGSTANSSSTAPAVVKTEVPLLPLMPLVLHPLHSCCAPPAATLRRAPATPSPAPRSSASPLALVLRVICTALLPGPPPRASPPSSSVAEDLLAEAALPLGDCVSAAPAAPPTPLSLPAAADTRTEEGAAEAGEEGMEEEGDMAVAWRRRERVRRRSAARIAASSAAALTDILTRQ